MKASFFWIFFIYLLCFGQIVVAQSLEADSSTQIEKESLIERTHSELSEGVFSLSRRLDSLLGSDRVEDEKSGSSLKLRYSSTLANGESVQHKFRIKSRLVLPRTQKRFNLVLQNLKDDLTEEDVKTADEELKDSEKDINQTVKESDFSAALRYVVKQSENRHIHTDAGVKFKIPLDPFVKLRANQAVPLSSWELQLKEGAEWFKSSGYAVGGSFSFLKKISQDFYFSQPNVARWTEEKQMIDFQNGLSLTQLLPSERSLNYFLSMSGESEPAVGVQSYSLGVTFRTWLGWPWLHFDLTPFGAWSRARNFVFQPAIAAHFELIIGSF